MAAEERREIAVRGIVQGVGFRPFVYGLASRLSLSGFVRNTARGVLIEIEGESGAIARFERELLIDIPPLATVDDCVIAPLPLKRDGPFRIDSSVEGTIEADQNVRISPDVATCLSCMAELLDAGNRRYRYPFTTCATCGPRLTVVTASPYDRERTTMARFAMCTACRREYEDPHDRRFHAETIACPSCGPRLGLAVRGGDVSCEDPVFEAARLMCAGQIGAIKGIGGYHLACDAQDGRALAALRQRKHRDEKPFAVMFSDAAAVKAACRLDDAEEAVLTGPARPIVLLERHVGGNGRNLVPHEAVAPGSSLLGAMLPSTPLQHLLLLAAGRPLVMTSGNRSQEPVAYDDGDAKERLRDIADFFLVNDRPIHVRCDDGVSRIVGGQELPVRRSRGHAPRPLRLPQSCPRAVLAVGGHLKNTFALGRHHDAFISHHIGDLDDAAAFSSLGRDIAIYEQLLRISPEVIAHDTHPDYGSTQYARDRAAATGLRLVPVQHHHAHVASCMAEHALTGPVIGVAFDGSGHGDDGTVWGGEFLVGDARAVERMGHVRAVPLPGLEQAVREPWRMALSHLCDAGETYADWIGSEQRVAAHVLTRMMDRGLNSPLTSSVGRLFDAVAALAGRRRVVSFEGQAAMELEGLAAASSDQGQYPYALARADGRLVIDTRPMIRAVAHDARSGQDATVIARRFHEGLATATADVCTQLSATTGISEVVLTGGVFLNAVLTAACTSRLEHAGLRVYRHRLVPPNDGGLSLGQLAVAAARLSAEHASLDAV